MASAEEIAQQKRVIQNAQVQTRVILQNFTELDAVAATHTRLGLGNSQILDDQAFEGTGTTREKYVAAMTTIGAIQSLLAAGHGTNLEAFAR